ncbi:P-loop NTPase family protein [Geminicoccus harenae]|uniref:hypothetical protein n=1 Tax=Geminicoccus harenae TaxID=2498453 RepID=UPI00168A6F2C|nr:hypothetical protein [Geminicoccus harenae]
MKFNHMAQRVAPEHFDTVVSMFQAELGFVELRRTERSVWMRQPGTNVDLQLNHSPETGRDADKRLSQVSFLSDTPRAELEKLAAWLRERGVTAEVGSYSTREFYLDAPEAFVDFVVEAMLPELADYGVEV